MTHHDTCILPTAYLPPIQWFAKLMTYNHILIEAHEHYVKQSYRNRCLIAGAAGIQPLIIPIKKADHSPISQTRIATHGNWQHLHQQAIVSAYQNSPYFEFYADDLLPAYSNPPTSLLNFNTSLLHKLCELLDLSPNIAYTQTYYTPETFPADDLRTIISPKTPLSADPTFTPVPYYQVFTPRKGFIPNLSIIDLLFNMGPEARIVLRNCNKG